MNLITVERPRNKKRIQAFAMLFLIVVSSFRLSSGEDPAVQKDFASGVGPITWGASTDQVISQLSSVVPHYRWADLARAREYRPADARLFRVGLSQLQTSDAGKQILAGLPYGKCMAQGEVFFVLSDDRLVRVVMRIHPACKERSHLFRQFANRRRLQFDDKMPVIFYQSMATTSLGGYRSSDGSFNLDIFQNGSPEPAR